ncbi:MAG TPA: riboflavin synthase [Chthoniobacterales bacterium]|jgi:riboflavin synthase
MFTGIVEEVAQVQWLRRNPKSVQLLLKSRYGKRVKRGDSVSVNGCCLTVTSHRDDQLGFDLLEETLNRSNLRDLKPESTVNIERAMKAGSRIDGHLVQGHVDCVGTVASMEAHGGDHRLEIVFPAEFSHYIVFKGSICINGVSLTVAEAGDASLVCWIIPLTFENTNIRHLKTGDNVNLEFDILAKYVERMLSRRDTPAPQRP